MFRPNVTGTLYRLSRTDKFMRQTFGAGEECPFGIVKLAVSTNKTIVRADSSASRGQADETVSDGRILIVSYLNPKNGDNFEFQGDRYKIVSTHIRRTVTGKIDHYECDLEILP